MGILQSFQARFSVGRPICHGRARTRPPAAPELATIGGDERCAGATRLAGDQQVVRSALPSGEDPLGCPRPRVHRPHRREAAPGQPAAMKRAIFCSFSRRCLLCAAPCISSWIDDHREPERRAGFPGSIEPLAHGPRAVVEQGVCHGGVEMDHGSLVMVLTNDPRLRRSRGPR
jgi:hypothetical protein